MTDTFSFELSGFESQLAGASAALSEFANGAAKRASDQVGASFEQAGARIERALARAAAGGEVSFKQLAKVVLEQLARIAINDLFGKSGGSGTPLFGARAAGGSVTPGGAYLVGETGPELFVPNQAGAVTQAGGAVSVHFHLGAGSDAQSIVRSQSQIAAAIARAVAYGRRNL
ncbi:MAG TPA: phage tail tape measure C-terminal domain-containing protein [Caulobacterales bacterium]|nr:phage tail tape measure C-terminal domain-containing protein [Caulobacterales bacterium]